MNAKTQVYLQTCCADNHQQWMAAQAIFRQGAVQQAEGVRWLYTPGTDAEVTIAFPQLDVDRTPEQLDTILADCYARRPLRQVACWSLLPTQPPDLGVRLLARGFEWGWQPHWMWLDCEQMRTDHPMPEGLQVALVTAETLWNARDLPYDSPTSMAFLRAASQEHPRRLWHFAAWLDGVLVGQSVLFVTTGDQAAAGIYNCGVASAVRNRGVGKAVVLAACRQAQALGYPGALLNATPLGEPVYRRLGFESIGYGQTWWLHRRVLDAAPPSAQAIALVEATGHGDLTRLDQMAAMLTPALLDAPLLNGMTLLEVAALLKQPAAAEWLVSHGAMLDVLTARTLGWGDRIPALLAANPELANRRSGPNGATPLHNAAWENDLELIAHLLAANADVTLQDRTFHATAAGWARHNGHVEAARLIEQAHP